MTSPQVPLCCFTPAVTTIKIWPRQSELYVITALTSLWIVDDLTFSVPFFQDSAAALAVEEVVNEGIVYVTSAGNEARRSYESVAFNPGSTVQLRPGVNEVVHLFDIASGDYRQHVSIPVGASLNIRLTWEQTQPAASDLNVYVVSGNTVVSSPPLFELLRPYQRLNFYNDPFFQYGTDFDLIITKRPNDPLPGRMKYFEAALNIINPDLSATFNEYLTGGSTVIGHANAAGAITVGAADYRRTPAFTTDPIELEFFSSAGGTPILFDANNNALTTPEIRQKPDFVGVDNGNTTFFGADTDADSFPNFLGTSAAAPHVAGLVALMLQADPSLTPAEVKSILTSTAIDMDDPHTPEFDYGFDYGTGHGFVDGMAAITKVLADSLPPKVMDVVVSSSVATFHDPYALTRAAGSGNQLRTVPVGKINAIDVVFSEWVDVDIDDLTVTGLERGARPTADGFTAPTAGNNFSARWTFDDPIEAYDYYLLSLDSAAITDADNNALDGEWINPNQLFASPGVVFTHPDVSRFSSGDGTAGGDFNFVISIFPGDANQDLAVGSADITIVFNYFFGFYPQFVDGNFDGVNGSPGSEDSTVVFNYFFVSLGFVRLASDVNGDGVVDSADLAIISANLGTGDSREEGDANGDGVVDGVDSALAGVQLGLELAVAA